jgi:hypothetical protein
MQRSERKYAEKFDIDRKGPSSAAVVAAAVASSAPRVVQLANGEMLFAYCPRSVCRIRED